RLQPRRRSVPPRRGAVISSLATSRIYVRSIPARGPIRDCTRFESLTRSRKENRNSLSLQRRNSAPPACVDQSSISFVHCCQPIVKEWPSFTKRFGTILPIRKCFQRSRNGDYSLSHGSLSWTARGLYAGSSKGS